MAQADLGAGSWQTVRRPGTVARTWKIIARKPPRLIGLFLILLFAFLAIFGPMLYPKVLPMNPAEIYAGPSLQHPLGTDFEGTDVLAEIVTGGRFVLYSAFLAALFHIVFGTAIGLLSGYVRGWTDNVLMRITDFFLTVPSFPVLLVLSTVWKFSNPLEIAFVLGILGWGGLARAVRSQTLSLRERGFIEAARGLGMSNRHIVFREIFPNIASYVAMHFLFSITGSMFAITGLFFLGVVPFSANNWGVMLNMAFTQSGAIYTKSGILYLLSPLGAIMGVTFGIVLFLDAVDEMFNPRLRGV